MASYRVTNNGEGGIAFLSGNTRRTVMPGEADVLIKTKTPISKSRIEELAALGFDLAVVRKPSKKT